MQGLLELVEKTKKDEHIIRKTFKDLYNFQATHPWIITDVLNVLHEQGHKNVPSFEQVIAWKEDYLINDYSKIYKQIKLVNPLLIQNEHESFYFYAIMKGLFKKQQAKGFTVGDRDNSGRLVTGCDLVLEVSTINLSEFLKNYYCINN